MWLTTKDGRHFNTDWIDKDRQIANNAKEGNIRNQSNSSQSNHYKNYNNLQEMADEFYKRTGIEVEGDINGNISDKYNKETIAETFNVLEQLQNKFHINDPDNKYGGSKVAIDLDENYPFISDKELAVTFGSRIKLNSKFYGLSSKELNDICKPGIEKLFHPAGTDANGTIMHEVGHTLFTNELKKLGAKFNVRPSEIQDAIHNGNITNDSIKSVMKELDSKFDKCVKKMGYSNIKATELSNPEVNKQTGISIYSGRNYHELMAEAFCDYATNSESAKEFSKILMKEWFNF